MTNIARLHRVPPLLVLALLGLGACSQEQPTAPETTGPAPSTAAAALRVVNSTADPGDGTCTTAQCTLREALQDPATTAIQFAPGLTGPITLAPPAAGGGPLRIDRPVKITGPSGRIVIQRRSMDPPFRIMRVGAGITVALRNLTIRGGKTDLAGGGLINYGTLTLTNCRVTDNESTKGGGGIDNHGPLTLSNSVVARNTGGGIANHNDRTLTLTNSTVTRNTGTGITDNSGSLVIRHSDITYNAGTGIAKSRPDPVILDYVRVVGNTGAGLSQMFANTTVDHSTIARNSGAGIDFTRGRVIVANSTIAGNSGGGIRGSTVPRASILIQLTNSTVSGNSAAVGAGIYAEDYIYSSARVQLFNTTVAFNTATQSGGGIAVIDTDDELAAVDMVNSIVARNSAPTAPDIRLSGDYSFASAGHTLIGDGLGTGISNDGGNLVGNVAPYTAPIDPLLELLNQNGGPTTTHALLAGSPAIDVGTAENCPATDQRGVPRPQGEACDMGSFERQ
jgi:CSLREA domain-containing protein